MDDFLIIDSNENKNQQKRVIRLAEKNQIPYEVKRLNIGDYKWEESGIIIERKTVKDFIGSIRSGRLETQLMDMDEIVSNNPDADALLFISGLFKSVKFDPNIKWWTVNHTIGSKCSIAMGYHHIKVLEFDNDTQLSKAIIDIKNKKDKGKKISCVGIRHSKTDNVKNLNFALYMTLPGVGEKRARSYLKTYPIFTDFLNDFNDDNLKFKIPKSTYAALTLMNEVKK